MPPGREKSLSPGKPRIKFVALVASLAWLFACLNTVQSDMAVAAPGSQAVAAASGDQTVVMIVNRAYGNCLDSGYDRRVYLNPCGSGNYYQQWQRVGSTFVNMQTGLCLDGNSSGRIYTNPCSPNQGNAYQRWSPRKQTGAGWISNEKTKGSLTAVGSDSVTGHISDGATTQSYEWTLQYRPDGPCGIEPLSMKVDEKRKDYWNDIYPAQESPSPHSLPSHPWTFQVTQSETRSVSATTSSHLGIEYTVKQFKASGAVDSSENVTTSATLGSTETWSYNVPAGITVWAAYGVHMHDITFHWHRRAQECKDLDSDPYVLRAPFSMGFHWWCSGRKCKQRFIDANTTPTNPQGVAWPFDPYHHSKPSQPPSGSPTSVTYTGTHTAHYHQRFVASARITSNGRPVSGGRVTFSLGSSTCTAAPDPNGKASCRLTAKNEPGPATLRIHYSGTSRFQAASGSVAFTITKMATNLAYTGDKRVANGRPAHLSAILREGESGTTAVAGRSVALALGEGAARQTCTATTDAHGTASCSVPTVSQPLNADATVPVRARFAGDRYYLASQDSARVRLEYYTGRATGITADVRLPLVSLAVGPSPDTGKIRTASASQTRTSCTAEAGSLLVQTEAFCPQVATRLNPGTAQATVRIEDARIGLPGLPVIAVSGLTASATSTCTATRGSVSAALTIAGSPVDVPTAPNSEIPLPGGGRIVVNEQVSTRGADSGLTVRAVHIEVPGIAGNLVDITLGTAASAAHNCL